MHLVFQQTREYMDSLLRLESQRKSGRWPLVLGRFGEQCTNTSMSSGVNGCAKDE